MAPVIPKITTQLDEFDQYMWQQRMVQQMQARPAMGIGEAKEASPASKDYINIRVEAIENGYIVKYSGPGVGERARFASNLTDVGTQITVAAVEMKLRGAEK